MNTLQVNQIPNGSKFFLKSQFGTNEVVKLSNDEFSGIPDRPIAYFASTASGITREQVIDSFTNDRYIPGILAIWQVQVDKGFIELSEN